MPQQLRALRVTDGSADTAQALWRSLTFFNLYRVAVAGVFLLLTFWLGASLGIAGDSRALFHSVNLAYLAAALGLLAVRGRRRARFDLLLTVGVCIDIAALTLLMHASGGVKGGLPIMLMVMLAGAGLVGHGRLTLLYASLASLAVLAEQAYRSLWLAGEAPDFITTGITCIGFFAVAASARMLARRALSNQELARQRGIDLDNQLWISDRIIRDVQDGVLVVTAEGTVRQYNPQAEALLGVRPSLQGALETFSGALARAFAAYRPEEGEHAAVVAAAGAARTLRARFVGAGRGGDVVIYLEDLGRIQAQAQQIKLAALGRLSANIAHEIRNPLAAIMQAAELLREEKRSDMQQRLIRIVTDNSRRLERMVRDVLDLGRRDRREPETLSLQEFLPVFLDEFCLHEKAQRSLFGLDIGQGATLVFDRAHVNQVLWNLMSNALRYCGGGEGAIRLVARAQASANRCELHIIDDGPGVAEEQRTQVFEPFFTTHSKGTGLGLYIARELCEANEAALDLLDNAPGAHFCITGRRR